MKVEKSYREKIQIELTPALENAKNDSATKCAKQQALSNFTWPEQQLGVFECDFSTANCDTMMAEYKRTVDGLVSNLDTKKSEAQEKYDEAKEICEGAKAKATAAQEEQNQAEDSWQSQRSECQEKHSDRSLAICTFGLGLQDACASKQNYETVLTAVQEAIARFTEEWTTISDVVCLLEKVVNDGEIDAKSLADCKEETNYTRDNGELQDRKDTFNSLKEEFKQCDETEPVVSLGLGTLEGKSWDLKNDGHAVEDYVSIDDFQLKLDLNEANVPFALCHVEATGPGKG